MQAIMIPRNRIAKFRKKETIYRACYANAACSGLQAGAFKELQTQWCRRRCRGRCEEKKTPTAGASPPALSQHHKAAAQHREPGYRERDLVIAAGDRSAAVTLVDSATNRATG